jgi:uncharacterized SAM-binding protein YcdF (DUF218 family)
MARYAITERGYRGEIVLEDESRSTWENVENAIPLIDGFERIKIVSNPFHAEKARLYLARQRPDLAVRLVRGADYRFGEWMPLKVVFAAYGRWQLRSAYAEGSEGYSDSHAHQFLRPKEFDSVGRVDP